MKEIELIKKIKRNEQLVAEMQEADQISVMVYASDKGRKILSKSPIEGIGEDVRSNLIAKLEEQIQEDKEELKSMI